MILGFICRRPCVLSFSADTLRLLSSICRVEPLNTLSSGRVMATVITPGEWPSRYAARSPFAVFTSFATQHVALNPHTLIQPHLTCKSDKSSREPKENLEESAADLLKEYTKKIGDDAPPSSKKRKAKPVSPDSSSDLIFVQFPGLRSSNTCESLFYSPMTVPRPTKMRCAEGPLRLC